MREPAPQMIIAGRFRIERELGRGGMGSVWLSTHLGLEVPVAVKFMTAGASAEAKVRFHREAKAAAQIRSANVVQILDYGIDDDLPYIAMELLEGEDLRARLKRVRQMSLADAYGILVPVARGLARAHEAHLVHRDLKPENIFLTRDGEAEIPKILDFGIAKALRPQGETVEDVATREGAMLGTPFYMSPEQARGRLDVDHRSDLWSLGVILYQLVTGKRPFSSKVMGELIMQICSDPVPPASSIAPHLPPAADRFFERALSRDPADRFQSAREMTAAFAELVTAGDPRVGSVPDLRFSAPPPERLSFTPPPATPAPAAAVMTVGLAVGPYAGPAWSGTPYPQNAPQPPPSNAYSNAPANTPANTPYNVAGPAPASMASTASLGGNVSSPTLGGPSTSGGAGEAPSKGKRVWVAVGLVGALGAGIAGTIAVTTLRGAAPDRATATITAPSVPLSATATQQATTASAPAPSAAPTVEATAAPTASASVPAARPRVPGPMPQAKPKRDMGY